MKKKSKPLKLHLIIGRWFKFDFEPTGVFIRSFVHESTLDPHLSLHGEVDPRAEDKGRPAGFLSWHQTKKAIKGAKDAVKGKIRHYFEPLSPSVLMAFFERFKLEAFDSYCRQLVALDLDELEAKGWLFAEYDVDEFASKVVTEKPGNVVEMRLDPDLVMDLFESALGRAKPPTYYRDRGPEGPGMMLVAARFENGALVDVMNATFFTNGFWNPFVGKDPVRVHPRGWYRVPDEIMSREAFTRLLGDAGVNALKRAAAAIETFFGPVVADAG